MSHMHGHDDRHVQDQGQHQQRIGQRREATRAEHERLYALPLDFLAAEVMLRGFGPGGPGYDDDAIVAGAGPTIRDICLRFAPDGDFAIHERSPQDVLLRQRIEKLVAEGLQQLEHASLVRCQVNGESGTFGWTVTRRGRAALEHGDIPAILTAAVPR